MRILFLGSSEFATPTFESIIHDGHEIVTAVTQPDRPRGRGLEESPTAVKQMAMEYRVPVITPENVNAPEVVRDLKSLKPDLAYVASFGQKIGAELLTAFPAGIVNLHASLLPRLRGAAPIQWAVINGDEFTGVTVFRLVERMDAGPILTQRRTGIGPDETADELHDRLARIGCDALRATLAMLTDDPKTPGTVQDESQATKAPKLKKTDGLIRFDMPVRELANRICGLWSWPGATCRFVSADGSRDEQVTLIRAVPYEGRTSSAGSGRDAGRITDMMSVQTIDSELMVLEIKPAGGKRMAWQDYVNGRRVTAGDHFLTLIT